MSFIEHQVTTAYEQIRNEVCALVAIFAEDGESPKSINRGLCEDFACEPQASLLATGISVDVVYTEDFEDVQNYGGHAWIRYDGRHFDAETNDGVESVTDLPFFLREIAVKQKQLSKPK